jgi:DNA-binding response OmpR family regulator
MAMRLLIAKLTGKSQHSLSIAMNSEHDVADFATDLDNCIELARSNPYDLALLIVNHQGSGSRLVVERVRQVSGRIPLLVLTTDGDEEPSLPKSLWAAGDVSEAPATPGQAIAETVAAPHSGTLVAHTVEVNAARELVLIGGRPLLLSQAEFHIFALLWRRRGRIVTSEELLSAVYGPQERPSSRVLPVFMFKLRRKLAAAGMDKSIQTAVGRGFIMHNPD